MRVIDLCRLLLCGQVNASAVPELGDPDVRAEVEQQLAAVGVGLRYAQADRCWVALVDEPLPDDVGLAPILALNETERAVAAASWLHLVFLPAERRAAATLDGLSLPAEDTERPSIDPDDLYGQFAHRMRRPYFDIVSGKLKRLGFLRLRDGRLEAGSVLAVLGGEPAIAEARRVVAVHKRFQLLRRQAAGITAELGLEPAAAASSVDAHPASGPPNGGPHDVRHTFATWLEEAAIPSRVIDELMGHASGRRDRGAAGSPMGRIYRETTPAMLARVTAALDERLGRALAVAAYLLRDGRDSGTVYGGDAL